MTMKTTILGSQFHLPTHTRSLLKPTKILFLHSNCNTRSPSPLFLTSKTRTPSPNFTPSPSTPTLTHQIKIPNHPINQDPDQDSADGHSRIVVIGAVSVGLVLFLMGLDDHKALALGPEGPLMEEFWDNMRRYALYVLTVSTGVAYTIFQPIFELLKNPLSAILVLTIVLGSVYAVSLVLSAMVGVSDFSYDYGY